MIRHGMSMSTSCVLGVFETVTENELYCGHNLLADPIWLRYGNP